MSSKRKLKREIERKILSIEEMNDRLILRSFELHEAALAMDFQRIKGVKDYVR